METVTWRSSSIRNLFFLLLILGLALPLSAQHSSKADLAKQLLLAKSVKEKPAPTDLADMKVSSETYSEKSGITHVYFQQQISGIPVHNAILDAHVTKDNELLTFNSRFVPQAKSKVKISPPTLTAEQAVEAAAIALGYSFKGELAVKETISGTGQSVLFDKGDLSLEDIPVQLMWQPMSDSLGTVLRLAWDLSIYEPGAQNWWSVRIDAQTGELLDKVNWVVHCSFGETGEKCSHEAGEPHPGEDFHAAPPIHQFPNSPIPPVIGGGSYRVFPEPLESPSDGPRQLITDPATGASPFGWHDTDGAAGAEFTTTQGNNVHAYTDTDNNNQPDPNSSPDGGPSLVFDFPLDLTQAPSTYRDASVTNLFYWNNYIHDLAYSYGFNEAAGNFQQNNYGNGGTGGDYVLAESQDGGGTNNANFATPPDGSKPRMQMYLGSNPNPDVDGSFDNGVVAHEYAHGISNRLTGGPATTSCLWNDEQMGEGWSDYFLLITTMQPGDQGVTPRPVGTYLFGQPPTGAGIRPTPYSTDLTVNPATYNTIKTASVPHGVGYVWAGMLWDMTWALMEAHGPTTGYSEAINLVMEGMKLQPCSPGFVDGRNAILAADVALYGSANQCLIWQVFARRGLGFSASQGSSNSRSDGTEAYDLPPTLPCLSVSPTAKTVCTNASTLVSLTANANITGGNLTLSLSNPPAGITAIFDTSPLPPGSSTNTFIIVQSTVVPGVYPITITGTNASGTFSARVMLTVRPTPGATTLLAPADGATDVYIQPTLSWNAVPGVSQYTLQVSTVPDFSTVIFNSTLTATSWPLINLNNNTTYYWRVQPFSSPCIGPNTATWSFTTNCAANTSPPTLQSPANAATGVSVFPTFDWSDEPSDSYTLEIASDAGFSNILSTFQTVASQYFHDTPLNPNTQYFWRVRANNLCLTPGTPSAPFSFTTNSTAGECSTTASTNVPVTIPSTISTTTSSINLSTCGTVMDVNVQNLDITHTWIGALEIELTSPSGTTVLLYDNACGNTDNILMNFDDEAISPYNGWTCPPTGNGTFRPFQPLSAFDGENLAGAWTLTVRTTLNVTGGSLNNWSLAICSLPASGTVVTCYRDADNDTYGNPNLSQSACNTCQPGWVLDNNDCNDNDSNIKPGATEVCDLIDNNCNGTTDEGFDGDGDGFTSCGGDCDDSDPDVNPGATEVCNGVDDNCDGIIDFPPVVTYASTNVPITIPASGTPTVTSTLTISGATGNITDMNVKDLKILHTWVGDLKVTLTSPGGTQFTLFDTPGGGNCQQDNILATFDDGATLTAADFENTCNPSSTPSTYAISGTYQPVAALAALNGASPNGTWTLTVQDFFNQDGGSIEAWGLEISTPGTNTTYYADTDGDGYGDPASSMEFNCTPVSGYVLDNKDCNDGNAAINPAATEVCDGVDNNCAGGTDEGNVCCPGSGILYVNDDATGLNNGNSWTNAFTSLQAALASTCPGITQIWVAAGTYKPTAGTDRTISFVLKNGIAIYGGFPGSPGQEGDFSARNLMMNNSILSGDIGTAGSNADNSYTVVLGTGTNSTAVLDGFTITGGNANNTSTGFGTFIGPTKNGGGMFLGSSSSPAVRNCHFTGNSASVAGGGMAIWGQNSAPSVTNCAFSNNSASADGGGFSVSNDYNGAGPGLTNCTFYGNTAAAGGAVEVDSARATLSNCIIWGNSSGVTWDNSASGTTLNIGNSIVQGGCPAFASCNSVQNTDPLFENATGGNLRLTACSPALDAGNDAANSTATDIEGKNRKFEAIAGGSQIDLGAYEFQSAGQTISEVTVSVSPASTPEDGAGNLVYTFSRNCVNSAITVNFTVSGTATFGNDYIASGPGTFGASGGSVTMAIGVASAQFVIDPTTDNMVELDETVILTLATGSGYSIGTPNAATGTITNDDQCVLSFANTPFSATEGNSGTTSYTLSLNRSNPVDISNPTVSVQHSDGTATIADLDYSGNFSWNIGNGAGIASTLVPAIKGDTKVEPNETFNVTLSENNFQGRNIVFAGGASSISNVVTINNDDAATVTLTGGVAQNEGNAGTTAYTFTATLNNPVQSGFDLAYATNDGAATTAGNDYQDNDGTLTFAGTAGETKTITVLVNGDLNVESNETFTVALGAFSGTTLGASLSTTGSPQTGTILNDDSAVVTLTGGVAQNEGNAGTTAYTFSATLNNPVQGGFTVPFTTNNGTAATADGDYTDNDGMLAFAGTAGEMKTITVLVNGDQKVEDNETFTVALGTPSAAGVTAGGSPQTGTISNDDTATLTLTGSSAANEGNSGTTSRTFTATLSNPVQGGFTVAYNTNDGTATTAGNDYQDNDGTLTFAGTANEAKTITVLVNGDFMVENNETYTVSLGMPSVANISVSGSPQTATILNDEVDFGDAPNTYGTLLANNGARHNASLSLYLGASVDGEADGQPGATASGDGSDDDGVTFPANIISASPTSVTVNASAFGKLDAWIDFNGDGDFADFGEKIFDNVAIAAGNNVLPFTPPAAMAQGNSFARFRISSAGGLNFDGAAADGEVEDYLVSLIATQFSINDPVVTEGNSGTTNLSFVISRPVNASASSVNYAITGGTATTADGDYQPLAAGTVNFTQGGSLTQTINVVVNGDLKVELDETVVMTLSNPVAGSILDGSGIGTITNDDAATITIGSPTIAEGNGGTTNLTFNISMSNPSDASVTFNFATLDGSATTATNDYQSASGSHTLTPGQTSKTVVVPIVGDCNIEPDENFIVRLSSLGNNGRAVSFSGNGATLDGTGAIQNDDALPVIYCPASFNKNTDLNLCSASVTVPLPETGSICGSLTLDFRTRTVDAANQPTGPWSNWIPAASNTQVFATGKHEIEWRATDGSGSGSCSFYLTVVDNQAPTALCKPATIFLNQSGQASLTVAQVNNGSSDNCNFTLSLSNSNFACANVGPNTVTLTATDDSNNSHSCQATVTVVDNLPPTILCKNETVYLDGSGQVTITHATIFAGSSDNCGFIGLEPLAQTLYTCANTGPNTVMLHAFDGNGNTASCSATLTVVDNLPPNLVCQNISIQLDGNGNANITPSQVFNALASSDNCGSIHLVSVSPSQFDCGEIGPNTVTLTANDGNGNTATCTAIVTVEDFFTNVNVAVTPEDCGMGNGSIVVTASVPGGQIAYSINGGASWQFSGVFNGVTAGTYSVVIQAFGGLGCTNAPIPTVVPSIGNPQTWHLDWDGDGYSAGVTMQACVSPGTGWYLASQLTATGGDCNDYAALQYPGQTWYRDWDNDGYSDGTTLVQCLQPTGFKHPSQLTQTWGDCNDSNPAIHPGAVEVCNGLDDDCDGQVDEGLADLTYYGNVTFSNQAQVNAWNQCYTVIQGNLTIQNSGIDSLGSLKKLRKVTGNVLIKNTGLDSLSWLMKLDTVGGDLTIQQNGQLQTIHGLDSLSSVGGTLKHYFNLDCAECCAIYDLLNTPGGIGGATSISLNQTGCNSVAEINTACAPPPSPIVNPNCPDCGYPVDEALALDLFPNPASSTVNVRLRGIAREGGVLTVSDQLGRVVYRQELAAGEHLLAVPLEKQKFTVGSYFVRVVSGKEVTVKKLLINR